MNYYRLYSLDAADARIIDVRDFQADGDAAAILMVDTPVSGISQELWNRGRKVTDFEGARGLLSKRYDAERELDCRGYTAGPKNTVHATIWPDRPLGTPTFELHSTPRNDIRLPILINNGGNQYAALIRNLSCTGAMIKTSAPLKIPMKIDFQCGSICAGGAVIWQLQGNFGIMFDQPICDQQLSEELLRSNAVDDWCNG